jgi:hypothetical protein
MHHPAVAVQSLPKSHKMPGILIAGFLVAVVTITRSVQVFLNHVHGDPFVVLDAADVCVVKVSTEIVG